MEKECVENMTKDGSKCDVKELDNVKTYAEAVRTNIAVKENPQAGGEYLYLLQSFFLINPK